MSHVHPLVFLFFFNDTPPTEIYILSLHDALPISLAGFRGHRERGLGRLETGVEVDFVVDVEPRYVRGKDRKSTRLNSSHVEISYAVFCLKKKKNNNNNDPRYDRRHLQPL